MSVLSPKEVLHLKDLGVEFKNTTCKWIILCDYEEIPILETVESTKLYQQDKVRINCKTLPAPNFQEILKFLPNYIEASFSKKVFGDNGQNVKCGLTIELGAEGWCIDYTCELMDNYAVVDRESATERSFTNENILTAAYDLLCWYAENEHLNNIQQ